MRSSVLALGAVLGLFTPSAPWTDDPASTQTIVLANFRIAPKPIKLAAGRPVTITFVNQSGGGHDFTAKRFFETSIVTSGSAPGGKISLASHEARSVTLIPRAGIYEAHCSHFLHASMGMVDEIVVG